MHLAVGYMNEAWNGPAQVEQCMEFDCCLGGTKRCPGKYGQAQVDGGGVEGIDRVRQIFAKGVCGIEFSCLCNQTLSKIGIDGILRSAACKGLDAFFAALPLPPGRSPSALETL